MLVCKVDKLAASETDFAAVSTSHSSNQDSVTVVNFMLNDLSSPTGKGLDAGLKSGVLILHLDLVPSLGRADTGQG
jgi:hypothetical protein